jgi:integrase
LARGGAERQLRPREARDSPATAEINAPAGSQDEKFTLIAASDEYFSNLAKQGKDPKTISSYRSHIDPFVRTCKKLYVEDVTKQDMIDFMDFLRKQPVVPRLHGNPARTIANRILAVGIFLKVFGKTGLLTKHERPKDHTKTIVAHTDEELSLLYAHDTGEETFLLDFFLGSMVRDSEGHNCRYEDLTGTTLTIKGKQHKTRTVEISPRLADAIRERGKRSASEYLFPNECGKPNENLLCDLQDLARRASAKFHCELHKLRKTGASRRYQRGCGLDELMRQLGHHSLAVTQVYLANISPESTKKAIADTDFGRNPKTFLLHHTSAGQKAVAATIQKMK